MAGWSLAPEAAARSCAATASVRFRPEAPRERAPAPARAKAAPRRRAVSTRPAQTLWEALRAWRLDEARRQELPPYVIFHDATLIEVARRRPASLDALADIPGIGRSKLDRYGAAVLALVASLSANPQSRHAAAGGEAARPTC